MMLYPWDVEELNKHANDELYVSLIEDVERVYNNSALDIIGEWKTVGEVCAKLTGIHRAVTIMRDCDAISQLQAHIIRVFIRDCKNDIKARLV